jgi:hypothetical protein
MKRISSVNVGSVVLYGAVLVAFWTFVFGTIYWLLGWAFGASSTFINMNLGNWTAYTLQTYLSVIWRSIVNGVGGALAGLLVALVYNAVASMMGGIKITLDD